MQTATVPEGKQLPVTANPVDSGGFPSAGSTTPVTWSSSDSSIATVTPITSDPTGMTANVKGVAPGVCQITANGTNPGSVFTPFTLTVTGGPFAGFVFTFGTPF